MVILFLFIIAAIFFYKVIFLGLLPFPGDLLVSEYSPWRTFSFLGYSPGTIPSKLQYFDTIRQIYPWKTLVEDLLKNSILPLWNPYNFSGHPLLANVQSSVFYPLNILYLVLPQITSWTILIVLQPFMASFFTFFFARELGIGKIGAVFASVAYGYSLFMSVFLEYNTIGHVILWFPLILFCIEKFRKKLTFKIGLLFNLSLLSSLLAGHIQIFGFVLLFSLIYAFFRLGSGKILIVGIFTTLTFGIGAVQLLPTLELINSSARIAQNYTFLVDKLLLQANQLILFLSPDFFGNPAARNYLINDTYPTNAVYIGLAPFIFAIFAALSFKKNNIVRFFTCASIILLLFLARSPFTEIFYKLEIPLFSTGSPSNAIFLLSFCLAVLCGFGVENWLKGDKRAYKIIAATITGLFLTTWILIVTTPETAVSTRNFIFSTGILAVFVSFFGIGSYVTSRKKAVVIALLILTLFDLSYFFHKFNPFVPKNLVFPKTSVLSWLEQNAGINRFWGYGTANIEANFATQYKIFSADGYDPLYPRWYGEFIQGSREGRMLTEFTQQTRSDAIIVPGFGKEDLPSNQYRLRVLDALGVKYILDRTENGSTETTFPSERFELIYDQDGWRIFENKKVLPRAFLADDYRVFKSKKEFEDIFFSKDFNPQKTILLEEELSPHLNDLNHSNRVQVEVYEPNKITFRTVSVSDSLLFLSDTYYPGWKAFVDEKETRILRANYAFRAVPVPEGEHEVKLSFKPQTFSLGAKISIISLVILSLCLKLKKLYS